MSRRCTRWLIAALSVIALALPVHAQNILTVRVESVDALVEDIDTVAVALGQEPGTGEQLLQMAGSLLGMPASPTPIQRI